MRRVWDLVVGVPDLPATSTLAPLKREMLENQMQNMENEMEPWVSCKEYVWMTSGLGMLAQQCRTQWKRKRNMKWNILHIHIRAIQVLMTVPKPCIPNHHGFLLGGKGGSRMVRQRAQHMESSI